jgi:membrane-bound serine protease (ClpP class)
VTRARRAALVAGTLLALAAPAAARHVNVVTISGSINPASSDYVQQAIAQSESDGAAALLLQLDTPGGLLTSTKDLIQAILNARVPVIVYVSPRGAWAASAGTFITLAGHVAAMAPGTSIGAASPISAGGEGGERDEENHRTDVAAEKAEKFTMAFIESIARERKRNVEWAQKAVREAEAIPQDEALRLGVIDVVAPDRDALLREIEGREVSIQGEPVKLELAGAELREIPMPLLTRLLDKLASPDIAVLLFLLGLLGLYVEFNQPGLLAPGILGGICLLLSAIAFQVLPFSWVGLLLLGGGIALVVAEIFAMTYGVLFALGITCLLLGGSMVFDPNSVPEMGDLSLSYWSVLVPAVAAFALFGGLILLVVARSLGRPQITGVGELIGLVGKSVTPLAPEGRVFVRGEYWTARADEPLPSGAEVEVTAVEGMALRVRRAAPDR